MGKMQKEDKEEIINSILDGLKKHIDEFDARAEMRQEKLLNAVFVARREVQGLRKKHIKQEEEIKALRHEVNKLNQEVSLLIGKERAANLIIHGVSERIDEDESDAGQNAANLKSDIFNLFNKVGIEVHKQEVLSVERLGSQRENSARPILVKCSNPAVKFKVFARGKELYSNYKISVYSDLTPTQRKEKKELSAVKKLMETVNIPAKIRGFSLVINNREFNWRQALELFQDVQKRQKEEEDGEEGQGYMSDSSICSNVSKKRKMRSSFSQ